MRTYNIPPYYRKIKEILIMTPDFPLLSTLIGSNYPCLELIFMVPKVFEPLKFDCKGQLGNNARVFVTPEECVYGKVLCFLGCISKKMSRYCHSPGNCGVIMRKL